MNQTPSEYLEPWYIRCAESGLVPDFILRKGIQQIVKTRLSEEQNGTADTIWKRQCERVNALKSSTIAVQTAAANRQHYEVPADFFKYCLGPHLKYSCAFWEDSTQDLAQAEENMLKLYQSRAELADGQRILELGCGWGSLSLWIAKHYPNAQITAVSNSHSQREYITQQAKERGYSNLTVLTEDIKQWQIPAYSYDRVISIEMFEHLKNYQLLLENIAYSLVDKGKLFVHIFCHRNYLYPYETEGEDNWMARYFFTGGQMPAADTLLFFQHDLYLEQRWLLSGQHYEKTSNAWLANHDFNTDKILAIFEKTYGATHAKIWSQRWRMFWMACAELFGHDKGSEWLVGHYLFKK